jgi:hypothetical protein
VPRQTRFVRVEAASQLVHSDVEALIAAAALARAQQLVAKSGAAQ